MLSINNLKDNIYKSCELLVTEKNLITLKNVKSKLNSFGYNLTELDKIEHDLVSTISQWRMSKFNNLNANKTNNNSENFDLYKALSIPTKENKNILASLQKKIFNLEFEVNKYKHIACRANKKIKLLEKKLHATIANSNREKQEFISGLKDLLSQEN